MPKITRSPDCGHSPKNQLLEEFAIARVTNDTATLDRPLSDDIEWTIVGQTSFEGKKSVMDAIKEHRERALTGLTIYHVTQHGKVGAVNGRLKTRGGNVIDFCDMCEFANTKGTAIAAITSYVIDHEQIG
jgi:hypothetical protein